jgi:protein-tyrosine phosphatase
MTTRTHHPAAVTLEVVHNVRHLGGRRLGSGGVTTASDVFRAASLKDLAPSGAETLVSLGITTIVDLRSPQEWQRDATPDLRAYGIKVIEAAVYSGSVAPSDYKNFPGHRVLYRSLLRRGAPAYATLATTLAEVEGGVLFHCAAGKDRTGLAAALLLALAGADEDEILADYTLSEEMLAPVREGWIARAADNGIDPEIAEDMMSARAEVMSETLRHLEDEWGGAEGYFARAGLSVATLDAARRRLAGHADS